MDSKLSMHRSIALLAVQSLYAQHSATRRANGRKILLCCHIVKFYFNKVKVYLNKKQEVVRFIEQPLAFCLFQTAKQDR